MDVQFVSPVDKFDEHVYKFSNKFGVNKHKITILDDGTTNTSDSAEPGDTSNTQPADLPKRTRSRSLKSETSELPDLSGYVGESDSTLNTMVDPACDSGDSESGDGGAHWTRGSSLQQPMTLEDHFKENGERLFGSDKRIWPPEELQHAYYLFSLITGESRVDTGCGSCRRAVINRVRGEYRRWKQDQGKKTS